MTPTTNTVTLTHNKEEDARALLDELCHAYADAYGVEPTTEKTSAFRGRATKALDRPGFRLVTACADGRLVGFAFGYTLSADTSWWEGLEPAPSEEFSTEMGTRTFVLSEIEVHRALHGTGVGRKLHDALLAERPEERATLATGPDAPVGAIYARWGWEKVGRVPGKAGDYYAAYDLFVLPLAAAGGR